MYFDRTDSTNFTLIAPMQFIDLTTQKERIREPLMRRLEAIVDSAQYIMGPEVAELEKQLAAYVGTKHCVSCSSGTGSRRESRPEPTTR